MHRNSSFCAKSVRYNIFTNGNPLVVAVRTGVGVPQSRRWIRHRDCPRFSMMKVIC